MMVSTGRGNNEDGEENATKTGHVLVVSFEDALPRINALEQRLKLAHIDRARIIGVVHL